MSESKDYITIEDNGGTINISEAVVATIATEAISDQLAWEPYKTTPLASGRRLATRPMPGGRVCTRLPWVSRARQTWQKRA